MLLRLSQGQLNLLSLCPRRFQHTYLDQLSIPTTPEQQERMTWGNRFHLLMQQRELGLLTDSFAAAPFTRSQPADESTERQPDQPDQQLRQCVAAFLQAAPEIFQPSQAGFRYSELRRTFEFQGYLFTVVYDLLLLTPQQSQILDWKTYPRPQNSRHLSKNWQTWLYPFVLAETSNYSPEQISMTYWFIQGSRDQSPEPQSLKFAYSATQHRQIQQDLSYLLSQLTGWLQGYEAGEPFPQIQESAGRCDSCPFVRRCQRGQASLLNPQVLTLAEIQEVAL